MPTAEKAPRGRAKKAAWLDRKVGPGIHAFLSGLPDRAFNETFAVLYAHLVEAPDYTDPGTPTCIRCGRKTHIHWECGCTPEQGPLTDPWDDPEEWARIMAQQEQKRSLPDS